MLINQEIYFNKLMVPMKETPGLPWLPHANENILFHFSSPVLRS